MTEEQQTTNLELSKELKELGVKQESLFWWICVRNQNGQPQYFLNRASFLNPGENISAFTVAELISILQSKKIDNIIISGNDTNIADLLAKKIVYIYKK